MSKNVSVGFRLKESEHEALKNVAQTEHRSIGEVMTVITRAFLQDYKPGAFNELLNKVSTR